jgi:hypothetical protein
MPLSDYLRHGIFAKQRQSVDWQQVMRDDERVPSRGFLPKHHGEHPAKKVVLDEPRKPSNRKSQRGGKTPSIALAGIAGVAPRPGLPVRVR